MGQDHFSIKSSICRGSVAKRMGILATVLFLQALPAVAQTTPPPPTPSDCAAKSYLECLSCCDDILASDLDKAAADYNAQQQKGRACVLQAIQKRHAAEAQAQATKDSCVSAASQFQQTNPPHYEFLVTQCNAAYNTQFAAAQAQFGADHAQCVAIFAAANQAYNEAKAKAVEDHLACQLGCKLPTPSQQSDVSGTQE
ncbi:MAG: hypothetical protein K1X79_04885 [Oligoflexia bacterium]|nr:hypothetical protein [Oligoflexia bacterium]